jgi:hypothetical protein
MWRTFALALLALVLCPLALSQTSTTVSGTILDVPDGQAWFGGTFYFTFRVSPSSPTGPYFWGGAPFSINQTISGSLDGSAHYSVSVPSNSSITPAGSSWDITVCPQATSPCFTQQSVIVTGATLTVSPTPPSIRINMGSPPPVTRAYTDTELVAGLLGQQYFNLSSSVIRVCSSLPCGWTTITGGGGAAQNPVNSLQKNNAGSPGSFQASNLSESGGVLTNGDTNSNRGPNPSVDITAPPFNARFVSMSAIPLTTGTITGGTNSLVVASNSGWQQNDGLALIGGGATNCGTPPSAPTVTASLAASMTGTGHAVAGATGSTSYSYAVIAVSKGGCYTAASPVTTISNGNSTLGATNIPITSCSNLAGLVTCTVGSTTGLATGMWVRIGGTNDDTEFGGRHNITIINGTQFTYPSNESSIYTMKSTTATGGTLYFWVENSIALPALPAGTNMFQEFLYRCTGASCALPANAASYSLIYASYPLSLGYIDASYGMVDDLGTLTTINQFSTPWFIPTTPPAANVNDMLVTTISNIAGTTFTLAANATNSTSSAPVRFDNVPAINLAQTTSNIQATGGGGAVHFPPIAQTGIGPLVYLTSSYLVVNSIFRLGSTLSAGATVELNGTSAALLGTDEDSVNSVNASFSMQTLQRFRCDGANPCIWRKGPQIKNLYIQTLGPGQLLVFDSTANAPELTENVQFNIPDEIGVAYYSYAAGFGGMFRNVSFTNGGPQTIGLVDTPTYINKDDNQVNFDYITGSQRAFYFECTINPPNSCGFLITMKMGEEWQGPITPILTVNGNKYGFIYMEHIIQDSGSEPIFVSQNGDAASLIINGTNGPGKDPGTPLGGNQPTISGNQRFGGALVTFTASLAPNLTGMNHDITMCAGQPAVLVPGYTGCEIPSLNIPPATYSISHTLNASEGTVYETGSGTTITANSALAGQEWNVYNISSGTVTLAISSGTLSCIGSTGSCPIPANQGVHVSCNGTNCSAFGLGGGTVSSLTVTGALNANGNGTAGNVGIKYTSASAYRYVDGAGSDSNDGLSPGTAFATPQHCNTVVVALGGGTCDARTLYTYTTSTEIDVGQHSPAVAVTLLVPPVGTWTCNVTGGTNRCLQVFNLGSVIGASGGQGTPFIVNASATANVVDVCGTEPSPAVGGSYIHWTGMGCASVSGATVSGAVIHIQALFDNSWVSDLQSGASSTTTKALYIHGVCCSAHVERVKGNGNLTSTNVPCTLGPANSGADIGPISCTGGGTGANQVAIVQSSSGSAAAHYHDIYTEADSNDNTTVVGVTGSSGLADVIDHLTLGADLEGGSTRYMIDIASGSSLIAHNIELGGISGNGINDHNAGRGTISPGASAVITDYSVQGCCGLDGYFTKPGFFGLTNNTGLQLFNTTTTCTTAATINTPCTTAAITLPVGYADTNYRVSCTGLSPTQFPQIQTVTKSNATFTITLNNLTAAAASYTSFDCSVGHN